MKCKSKLENLEKELRTSSDICSWQACISFPFFLDQMKPPRIFVSVQLYLATFSLCTTFSSIQQNQTQLKINKWCIGQVQIKESTDTSYTCHKAMRTMVLVGLNESCTTGLSRFQNYESFNWKTTKITI